jgi:hypothetical protein
LDGITKLTELTELTEFLTGKQEGRKYKKEAGGVFWDS